MDNLTMLQGFEWYLPEDGMHWNRLAQAAPQLQESGINMIWLPPAYKGAAGRCSVGYDVYDTYDLGEFDQKGSVATKYGTKEEYLAAVHTLQQHGIQVLADVVLNHMMGADATERVAVIEDAANNREQAISGEQQIMAWTRFDFPGRGGKYSDFHWNASHFSGTDWDDGAKRNGIFCFKGKTWNRETDTENGNYDYLMGADLDTDNPETVKAVTDWGKWYLDAVPVDGFRLDAVKHISFDFYRNWLQEMRAHRGSDFFAVGEYWSPDLGRLLHYLERVEGSMSLFDVPLHFAFTKAANSNGMYDLGRLRQESLAERMPDNAVTFVDNHDTQPGQALSSFIPVWFKPLAYAYILLQEKGIPCVFYGDYYGIPHDGIAPVAGLRVLCQVRARYAYGPEHAYFDDCDVVGFTRAGDEEHPQSGVAVLMTDHDAGSKYMQVNAAYAGRLMRNVLDDTMAPVTLDEQGGALFSAAGGAVSVWVLA